jgi:hypothetical protein
MARKAMVLLVGGYLAVLGVLAISLHNASPGPASQEILGIGIGRHDQSGGIVYLSGRYLQCVRPKDQIAGTSTCRVGLAGRSLEIRAQRNPATHPNQLGGSCEAFYAGKAWPCRIDSRHVHVAWFAYLDEPLGLDNDQIAALRQHFYLENLPEPVFFAGIRLAAIITAFLSLLFVGVWLWRRVSSRFLCALTATGCAVIAGWGVFFMGMFLTNGFWD